MVMSPRKVEIRDGTITLPEDMLEESGIGTSDGMVIVDLRETGEIIVRASDSASKPYPVSPALAALRQWVKDHPESIPPILSAQEQIDAWDESFAQGIVDHFTESMRDVENAE
ncbi:MAG: hypothetical protein ACTHMX_05475 [Thermomicrobiales bacterium]